MTKTVLIGDDHPALRVGLQHVLEETGDFSVIGEAGEGDEILRLAKESKPNAIVMDIRIDGVCSFEAIERIHREVPDTSILVFSGSDDAKHVRRALRAGAVGYVVKNGQVDEVLRAVREVADGKSYLSPGISEHLRNAILEDDEVESALSGLTKREREVLRLVAEGDSSREIAEALGVSPKTVETHRARLMSKLGIHKNAKLVRFAMQAGVLD